MNKQPTKTALVYAVDLLSRRAYGSKELTDKLQRRGYSAEETAAAIAKLTERRYLDDAAFLESAVSYQRDMQKYSWREIEYRLQKKGFARSEIQRFRHLVTEEDELCAACRAVRLKKRGDDDDMQRVRRYLYAHGFSSTVIEKACKGTV